MSGPGHFAPQVVRGAAAEDPDEYEGAITIEWRAFGSDPQNQVMPGWQFRIALADGRPVLTVTNLTLHVPAGGAVWAECEMFADPDGNPVYGGTVHRGDDGLLTGKFCFRVAGMSVAP